MSTPDLDPVDPLAMAQANGARLLELTRETCAALSATLDRLEQAARAIDAGCYERAEADIEAAADDLRHFTSGEPAAVAFAAVAVDPTDRLRDELAASVEEFNAVTEPAERVRLYQDMRDMRRRLGIGPEGVE